MVAFCTGISSPFSRFRAGEGGQLFNSWIYQFYSFVSKFEIAVYKENNSHYFFTIYKSVDLLQDNREL